MKFEVIDTKPPEQELQCLRCNTRFHTDPSIQMNLVLIDNVLLPQCPICKTIEDAPEFKKEAKMNIKDCTQTKDGTPVRIYEVYEDKTHGAWFNDVEWIIAIWDSKGENVLPSKHALDLDLSDWKEKIPWDCLRPEIKVVARDKCGQWLGHEIEPNKDGQDGIWCSAGHEIYALDGVKMPQGPADWKEAIARRPE
jgi:hypothetical protein